MRYIPPFGSDDPDAPYVDRNTATAVRGSAVSADFFMDTQAEILSVIQAAGMEPDEDILFQMALAIQSGRLSYAEAGGTANALTATFSPAPAELQDGMTLRVKLAATNTGGMTLNVNGLGALPLLREDGSPAQAGDAVGGRTLSLTFDRDTWIMQRSTGFVPIAGGVDMTGRFRLSADPVEDRNPATKAYVDRPTNVAIDTTTTLTQAQLRRYVQVSGAASYTINLPNPTQSTGGQFFFYNASSSDKTLSTPSGNFVGPNGTETSTMSLPRGAFVWVIAGFDNWIVVYQSYSYAAINSTTTLRPSALNGYVQLGGASTYTVTLPAPSSFSGAELEIYNAGSQTYTLRTPSGNFVGPKGSGDVTVPIAPGEYFMLRAGAANWIVH